VASLTIKLPDDQKTEIEAIAERKNYNSTSEYVREALRDQVEEDLVLRSEVVKKLRKRLDRYREGETELESHRQVLEELGLDED
jgi:Arc/MetJ-type ribon-helix-helix transcriptional regulator